MKVAENDDIFDRDVTISRVLLKDRGNSVQGPTFSAQTRRYLLAMPHFSMNAVMSYTKMKSRPRPSHRKSDFSIKLLLDEVMAKRRFARRSSLESS